MNTTTPLQKIAVLGGSRILEHGADKERHIRATVACLLDHDYTIRAGCAHGADTRVINAVLAEGAARSLEIYAVGSQWGSGFPGRSGSPAVVSEAKKRGAMVHWLAGGPLDIPVRARLALRSQAACHGADIGIWWLAHPRPSSGSLLAAAHLARGGGLVAICPSFPQSKLPPLPGLAGAWTGTEWPKAYLWIPAQGRMF